MASPEEIASHITRRGLVDGRHVVVFDGLVPAEAVAAIEKALIGNPFTRLEVARPETSEVRHWAVNLAMKDAERLPIFRPSLEAAAVLMEEGCQYRVTRAYCNYSQHGDMLYTHTDCPPEAGGVTALWYIASEWDVDWGGETLFFNAEDDAEFVVSPKQGRLVIFDGALLHAGRPPNRICYAPRFSFAFKIEKAPS